MGQPWILVVTAICVTHMALSTNVQYEGITDTAVMQTVTGLRPSTASVGFGFVVTGDTKSNKFRVAVAAGFVMEIVIPSATQFPANRYLSVFITNPTSKTREHCKVLYEELRKGRMTASIVRTTGEDINGKTVDFVVARNAFVAKFGVESIGKAGIMPLDDESKICKFPSYNNAPEFDNGLKMIEIELEPTNFPPNAEVNFPAGVSFMVPKSPTTTAPTTTTIKH
uniref:DOMON domain-containing protein n=1 Tax=Panagrellus redivivus TaxID=6233 RepID=A0A7E4VSW0_PANRE